VCVISLIVRSREDQKVIGGIGVHSQLIFGRSCLLH
jgi:hypothetical protein